MRLFVAIAVAAPCLVHAQLTDWKRMVIEDRMGGPPTIAFYADSSERFPGATEKAALVIGCEKKRPKLVISAGVQLQPEYGGGTTARIKLDEGAAVTVSGSESTSGDGMFINGPAEWIRRIAGAKRVMLEVTPFRRGKGVVSVMVAGLAVHATEIEKHCGIRLAAPK